MPDLSQDPAVMAEPKSVLVVDDSKLQRRLLTRFLSGWGFKVSEAASGDEAMDMCRRMLPDIVVSDWMMPGMDGLEFCRAFRDMPSDDYGYFILLTSKSEQKEITEGFEAGADDFVVKPVDPNVLRARISAGERILNMQRELSQKNRLISETLEQLSAAYDSIDRDLKQAKKIQQSLVPETYQSYEGADVSLLLKPCGHVGGDLVGMFSPNADQVGFYNIDVSGHGITSAMMTARLGGYLSPKYFDQNAGVDSRRDEPYNLRDPAAVAATLNERLLADRGIEEYFTMAYGTADLRTGRVKMVQAGHPHPLLIRKNGDLEFVGTGGVPIGLLPSITVEQFEVQLEPGDSLLFYSDGFTECTLKDGEMLEPEGFLKLVERRRTDRMGLEFLDDLFWGLTEMMEPGVSMDDDISATLFEYRGINT
ncbi:MAG: PP2C family protein-serine/threonine phosphatase [Arenibacterium sp.]